MEIVRTETEIDRVLNWAAEGVEQGTRYSGMSYEQGILDICDWLTGHSGVAPDED